MSAIRKFFRPAEKHEDGRYKTYNEMSEAGKEATKFRLKVLGWWLVSVLIAVGIAAIILEANQRHEKALETGEYKRMFRE